MVPVGLNDGHRNAATTRSGFVLVSTYAWTLITIGVAIARFAQGHAHKVEVGRDDAAIFAATTVYVGATVSWQYAVNGGLGKDLADASAEDIELFFKAIYVAALLGIFAMALAKLSSALLIERVASQPREAKSILFGMTAAWAIFSTFAMSFQCGPPQWTIHSLQCGNRELLLSVIALNMLTDLVLALWIVPTLWHISLDKEKSWSAGLLFGARAIVAFVGGGQIWAVLKVASSDNPTRDAVELVVLTQSVTSLSLIVASIPRIKRVIGVGGSGIAYPRIQATELSLSRRSLSRQNTRNSEPKLVPSGTGKFTVTVSSKGNKARKKPKVHPDWQELTMGTSTDEHTSTSSLFSRDEREGVLMQREVRISVEECSARNK